MSPDEGWLRIQDRLPRGPAACTERQACWSPLFRRPAPPMTAQSLPTQTRNADG